MYVPRIVGEKLKSQACCLIWVVACPFMIALEVASPDCPLSTQPPEILEDRLWKVITMLEMEWHNAMELLG